MGPFVLGAKRRGVATKYCLNFCFTEFSQFLEKVLDGIVLHSPSYSTFFYEVKTNNKNNTGKDTSETDYGDFSNSTINLPDTPSFHWDQTISHYPPHWRRTPDFLISESHILLSQSKDVWNGFRECTKSVIYTYPRMLVYLRRISREITNEVNARFIPDGRMLVIWLNFLAGTEGLTFESDDIRYCNPADLRIREQNLQVSMNVDEYKGNKR